MTHGFKTHNGQYKHLGIVVVDYKRVIWAFRFYDKEEEWEAFLNKRKLEWPGVIDAVYKFNSENPLKEQAVGAVGTTFSRILCNIIDNDLEDRSWKK